MNLTSESLIASLAPAAVAPADATTPEEAAIASTIESVVTFADRGEFEALKRLYAPEVEIDYTSLAGGKPEVKSAAALMTEWAGLLPGFDRTRHAISNLTVQLNDSAAATATADVVADHWLGSQHWQVSGRYDYRLIKDGRNWRITAHRLTVAGEQGGRDIFGPAAAAAKARPYAYLVRQRSRQVVLDFLTGLEDKDMARVNGVWADDAVQEMPYVPNGFPTRVVGKDALIKQYAGWPQNAGRARFTDALRFYPTYDPEVVIVEYHGVTEVRTTGRVYDQRYFGLFHVEEGKIQLFREYFDPNVFAYAFGLEEG